MKNKAIKNTFLYYIEMFGRSTSFENVVCSAWRKLQILEVGSYSMLDLRSLYIDAMSEYERGQK
jgi:hypothetical protein